MILVMVDTQMEMTGKGGAQAYNYWHDNNDDVNVMSSEVRVSYR